LSSAKTRETKNVERGNDEKKKARLEQRLVGSAKLKRGNGEWFGPGEKEQERK